MNLKRLNGWQRVGILLSAIWLVVVAAGSTLYILDALNGVTNDGSLAYLQFRERAVIRAIGWGLVAWIIPSVLAYLLGWGVGWVWRGFKLKGESNE